MNKDKSTADANNKREERLARLRELNARRVCIKKN